MPLSPEARPAKDDRRHQRPGRLRIDTDLRPFRNVITGLQASLIRWAASRPAARRHGAKSKDQRDAALPGAIAQDIA